MNSILLELLEIFAEDGKGSGNDSNLVNRQTLRVDSWDKFLQILSKDLPSHSSEAY